MEATDWAASLANLPEEQRGPLFGLPVPLDDDDKYIMIQCLSVTFLFIPAPTPAPLPRPELLCLDKT